MAGKSGMCSGPVLGKDEEMTKGDQMMKNMSEIQSRLNNFDSSLNDLQSILNQLFHQPHSQFTAQLSNLDKAKFDLMASFAMTSLFRMYLRVNGVNPTEHPLNQELDRIKMYMSRAREIKEKASAPRLDQGVTKRLVRNALWDAAQKGNSPAQNTSSGSSAASKRALNEASSGSKAKKSK